jgi:hypothetical protein
MGGIYKYAAEMGSGAMIYITNFIKTGSGIQKLIGEDSQTHRRHGDRISLLSFFQNKESRLIKSIMKNENNRNIFYTHNSIIIGLCELMAHGRLHNIYCASNTKI